MNGIFGQKYFVASPSVRPSGCTGRFSDRTGRTVSQEEVKLLIKGECYASQLASTSGHRSITIFSETGNSMGVKPWQALTEPATGPYAGKTTYK